MKNRLSKKAGGKIVIHDPNTPPLPNEYGLELRPNTASSIAVQKNDIKRMASPFKPNCTSAWNGTVYNVQTDTAYTFAVSTASIRQYKMGLIFAQNLVKLLMYEN